MLPTIGQNPAPAGRDANLGYIPPGLFESGGQPRWRANANVRCDKGNSGAETQLSVISDTVVDWCQKQLAVSKSPADEIQVYLHAIVELQKVL